MTLKSLEDHNRQAWTFTTGPVKNGIACPNCGSELMDSNPSICLTSHPPQWAIHCPECGYSGTRR
jgi:DNA-directed RNA polymerase subunit RPC12/RpoP